MAETGADATPAKGCLKADGEPNYGQLFVDQNKD
jgi:hypothetical protein